MVYSQENDTLMREYVGRAKAIIMFEDNIL